MILEKWDGFARDVVIRNFLCYLLFLVLWTITAVHAAHGDNIGQNNYWSMHISVVPRAVIDLGSFAMLLMYIAMEVREFVWHRRNDRAYNTRALMITEGNERRILVPYRLYLNTI